MTVINFLFIIRTQDGYGTPKYLKENHNIESFMNYDEIKKQKDYTEHR